MRRTDGDGNVDGMFQEGDPDVGQVATEVPATWLNAVQEEIVNVAIMEGAALNPGSSSQMVTAMNARFGRKALANTWLMLQTLSGGLRIGATAYYFNSVGDVIARDVTARDLVLSGNGTVAGAVTVTGVVTGVAHQHPSSGEYAYVEAEDFQPSTAANMSMTATSVTGAYVNAAGATPVSVRARVRVPRGATVTGLDIIASNGSGGSLSLTTIGVEVTEDVSGSSSPTITDYVPSGNKTQTFSAGSPKQWRNVALSGNVIVTTRGTVALVFLLPGNSSLQVYGARVSYTETTLAATT